MKRFFLILTILVSSISLWAEGYDVKIDGIYYKINAKEKTAEVTNRFGGKYSSSDGKSYYGAIAVPETIEFKGTTLKVTSIGEYAFYSCELTSISLSNNILSVKSRAFCNCSGLTSITLPSNVTSIEYSAFSYCGLTDICIPNRVESIGEYAFAYCNNLKKITIENGEKDIEFRVSDTGNVVTGNRCDVFADCPIETLYLGRNISHDKLLTNRSPFRKSSLKKVTIGNSVTCINEGAFSDCKDLVSIEIANSVKKIESGAFSGCFGLTSINIPEGVTIINNETFKGCSGLISINIPSSVTSIGMSAFQKCTKLTSIIIPESVTNIDLGAFSACYRLASITLPMNITHIAGGVFRDCSGLTSITIPDGVTRIDESAFNGCSSLTSVTFPEGVTAIGTEAFLNCKELKIIELPNSLTTISKAAFQSCEGLNTVIFGKNIKVIETSAFDGCTELSEIYCYSKTVPQAGDNLFKDSWIEFLTLYVPYGTSKLYQAQSPWSKFGTIVEMEKSTHTLTYMIDGEVYKVVEYDTNDDITPVDSPTKEGYTFSGWSEIPKTMPAEDVTITGSFTINSYKLTYMVDGKEYKTYTIEYGCSITPEGAPGKEGYTFSGWEGLPETMPANDLTVTAVYNENEYWVTYKIDGVVFSSEKVAYGSIIVPPTVPDKEGYDFSWAYIPKTMPACDVTIYGSYVSNAKDCLLTVKGINGGTFALRCKTNTNYSFLISPEEGWKINTLTFNGEDVTTNLTNDSYTTPTLAGDSEISIVFEQDGNEVKEVNGETQIRVYANASVLTIQNSGTERQTTIYTTDGKMVKQVIAAQGTTQIPLQEGYVYLVKIGERTFKVAI